jgi:prepilin-type N-terminal cleavage/methylation domain-containing protein
MPRRSAFTLIELLIVMVVVLILSGAILAAIGMVKSRAKEQVCRTNLGQIGMVITVYRAEQRDGHPPGTLIGLFASQGTTTGAPTSDQALAGEGISRSLRCPLDPSKGTDPAMGMAQWIVNPSGGYNLTFLFEPGSSYGYETSSDKLLDPTPKSWFFPNGPVANWPDATWADGKAYQLKHGNSGGAYRAEFFPIVRCWHHDPWPTNSYRKRVLNVAWDGSVFWSAPSGRQPTPSPDEWEQLAK